MLAVQAVVVLVGVGGGGLQLKVVGGELRDLDERGDLKLCAQAMALLRALLVVMI